MQKFTRKLSTNIDKIDTFLIAFTINYSDIQVLLVSRVYMITKAFIKQFGSSDYLNIGYTVEQDVMSGSSP